MASPLRTLVAALLLTGFLPPALPSAAAQGNQQTPPCSAAESRQFDFWIGQWEVRLPNGDVAGLLLQLEGQFRDGAMVLEGETTVEGKARRQRIR